MARNIVATLRGEARRAFSFQALGKMGALGRRSAVAEIFGLKVSGFLAWWLWRTIYLAKLPGLDRKIRVATDWALDFILPPDIVQLKLGQSASLSREHFEPRQIIFRQGDRGERLYIVVDGEVEMLEHEQRLVRTGLLHAGEVLREGLVQGCQRIISQLQGRVGQVSLVRGANLTGDCVIS